MRKICKLLLINIILVSLVGCSSHSSDNARDTDVSNQQQEKHFEKLNEKIINAHEFQNGIAFVEVYTGNEDEQWRCIDKKGNVIFSLRPNDHPETDFIDGIARIHNNKEGEYHFIDNNGNLYEIGNLEENETVNGYYDVDGHGEVWTKMIVDTSKTHDEYYRVLDVKGNELYKIKKTDDFPQNLQLISVGDDVYEQYDSSFTIDLKNGKLYDLNLKSMNREEKRNHIDFTKENISSLSQATEGHLLIDRDFNVLHNFGKKSIGTYSSGLVYVQGGKEKGFYDQDGNQIIDLSEYDIWSGSFPAFEDDICAFEFLNPAGKRYITVLDREGNQLFEPIRGSFNCYGSCFLDGKALVDTSEGRWLIDKNGNKITKIPNIGYTYRRNKEAIILWNQDSKADEDEYYYVDLEGNLLFQKDPIIDNNSEAKTKTPIPTES